jgi:hypothetical protein
MFYLLLGSISFLSHAGEEKGTSPPAVFYEPSADNLLHPFKSNYATPMTDKALDSKANYRPICIESNSGPLLNEMVILSHTTLDAYRFEKAKVELKESIPTGSNLVMVSGIPVWIQDPSAGSGLDFEICFGPIQDTPLNVLRAYGRSVACRLPEGLILKFNVGVCPPELMGPAKLSIPRLQASARDVLCRILSVFPVKSRFVARRNNTITPNLLSIRMSYFKDGVPVVVQSPLRYQYKDDAERKNEMMLNAEASLPLEDCKCE